MGLPLLLAVDTGTVPGALVACVVAGVGFGLGTGAYGAHVAEAFPTATRYSGASVAYALGSVAGGALAPLVATVLFAETGTGTAISAFVVVLGLVSLAATLTLRSPYPGPSAPAGVDRAPAALEVDTP